MKMSDIFKREAALPSIVPKPFGERDTTNVLFPVETGNPGDFRVRTKKREIKSPLKEKAINLPGMDECNCQDILDIDPRTDISDTQRQHMLGDKYDKQVAHRVVLDKILKLMHEPDDVKRLGNVKNYLLQIKMKSPTVEPSARFKQHLDHHLFNAGLDESYLGYKKEDLGGLHVKTQGEAQQAQTQARFPTNYNDENCAVCRQYVDSINNKASKHKERVKNAIMMGTAATPEDAERSASSIVGDMFDDFQKGEMRRGDKSPEFKDARKIFDDYNKHLEKTHNDSLVNPDTNKNIPVVRMGKEDVAKYNGRNPLINRLYDTLTRRLTTGWGVKRREDFPSTQLRWDAKSGDNMFTEDMTDKQKEQLAKDLVVNGEVRRYQLPSTIKQRTIFYPSIPYTDQEKLRSTGLETRRLQKIQDSGGTDRSVTELPWATLNVIPRQEKFVPGAGGYGYQAETKGGYFTKDRVFKHVHQYDQGLDKRLKEGEPSGMIPDIHGYLFQRALMKPDTSGMEKYNSDLLRHESQPEHKLIPTGETEEIEEPVVNHRRINHIVKLPAGKRLHDIDIASNPDSLSFEPFDTAYARHKDERKAFEKNLSETEPELGVVFEKLKNFDKEWKNTHQIVGKHSVVPSDFIGMGVTTLGSDGDTSSLINHLTKSFNDEGTKHLNAKKQGIDNDARYHENNFIGIGKTIDKLKSLQLEEEVPVLDESGKPKTRKTIVPKYDKVPVTKKERIPKPTLLEKVNAQLAYQKSFDSALSKVYKGMDRKEALEKLQADHAAAVENSRPSVPFVQAKKVNTMSKKFNSKIAADPTILHNLMSIGEHIVRPFIDQAHLVGNAAHNLTNGGPYDFVSVPDHGIDPNGSTWSGHKYISIPDVKEIAKQRADWRGAEPAWAAEAGGAAGYAVRSVVDKIKGLRSKLNEPHPIIETLKKLDRLENRNSSAASTINILSATLNGTKSGALGCTDCGRSKGKSDGKCPGKGSINCKASVRDKMRGNAAESASPSGNPSGPQ